MITMKRLGDYGRLGNQLFQYAALCGVSARCGYVVRLPREHDLAFTGIFRIPHRRLTADEEKRIVHQYREQEIRFSPALFEIPDDCNIHGYFQSEKYFAHCAADLRRSLRFRTSVRYLAAAAARHTLGLRWFSGLPTVSMHVRRGDYVGLPDHHPLCSDEYYRGALDVIESRVGKARVVIFSDDIEWCRTAFTGPRFRFSEGNDHATDLALMAQCDHHVIANSSYSWWGAWLSPNEKKLVVAPRIWRGPKAKDPEAVDQTPADWLRM